MVPENAVESENNFAKMIGKDNNRLSAMSEVMRRESNNMSNICHLLRRGTPAETAWADLDRLRRWVSNAAGAFCAKGERGDVIYEFI